MESTSCESWVYCRLICSFIILRPIEIHKMNFILVEEDVGVEVARKLRLSLPSRFQFEKYSSTAGGILRQILVVCTYVEFKAGRLCAPLNPAPGVRVCTPLVIILFPSFLLSSSPPRSSDNASHSEGIQVQSLSIYGKYSSRLDLLTTSKKN